MWFFLPDDDLRPLYFLLRQIQAQNPHRSYIPLNSALANDLTTALHKIQAQTAHGQGNPGQAISELKAINLALVLLVFVLGGYIIYTDFL